MPTNKNVFEDYLSVLALSPYVSYRPMMGEYVLYYKEKVVGGVYDDRLLVKITPSSEKLLEGARREPPYDGAAPMLRIVDYEDTDRLFTILESVYEDLPAKRKK